MRLTDGSHCGIVHAVEDMPHMTYLPAFEARPRQMITITPHCLAAEQADLAAGLLDG